MADKRISQLAERVDIANNDVVAIVASGATATNKATISSIQAFMQGALDVGVTSVGVTISEIDTAPISVTGSPITTSGNITINLPRATNSIRGVLDSEDFINFSNKQNTITLTTSGTSGDATFDGSLLNIPNYTTDTSGFVTLNTAQTITGLKTFSLDSSFNGVSIGRGGGNISSNTRVGNSTLRDITTGTSNSAFGEGALRQITTGFANTAIGFGAMLNSTTGSGNTAIGNATLAGNNGSNNIAVGNSAGRFIVNGTTINETSSNSVYLGVNTKPSADGNTNEIVIGHNAVGNGSNTVTIGKSSTILNKFFGTVIHADAVNADESATLGQVNNILGNFVTLDTNQTITGVKTFDLDSSFNSVSVGRGGGDISSNTRVGFQALFLNSTGDSNTAIGSSALLNNTIGRFNTAVGTSALRENISGSQNTANGTSALQSNTIGNNNTAIGRSALRENISGSQNTANGTSALQSNTTGGNNTAIGFSALQNNTTGGSNTAIGRSALLNNISGNQNTAIGNSALQSNTTGGNNTALGFEAGSRLADNTNLTVANNSIFIGVNTKANADSQTNQIVIGHNAVGLGSNTSVLGNNSTVFGRWFGNLLIGDSVNTGEQLQVTGTARFTGGVNLATVSGNVGIGVTGTPSDKLEVNGNARIIGSVTAASGGFGIGGFKLKEFSATDSRNWIIRNDTTLFGDFAIQQSTTQTGSTYSTLFYISPTGNVGIGTNQPSAKLDVNGTVKFNITHIPTIDPQVSGQLYRNSLGQLFISQ